MPADCGSPAVCVDSFSVIGSPSNAPRCRPPAARRPTGRLERSLGRAHRDRVQRHVARIDRGEVHLTSSTELIAPRRVRPHLGRRAEGADLVAHGVYPTAMVVLPSELTQPAERVGARLRDRGETVAVAEGSAGGSCASLLRCRARRRTTSGAPSCTHSPRSGLDGRSRRGPRGRPRCNRGFRAVSRALDRGEARHDVGDR